MTEAELEGFIAAHLPLAEVPGIPAICLHQPVPNSGLSRIVGALGADEDAAPYWAHRWGGGLVLARWIAENPGEVAGFHILDLGCGSGLVGIAAALAGATRVDAVDCDPRAVVAAGMNARANGVRIDATCADPLDGPVPAAELLLVGDLFYDAALALRTSAFLDRCLAAGRRIVVGDPYRASLPLDRLDRIADYPAAEHGAHDGGRMGGVFRWKA